MTFYDDLVRRGQDEAASVVQVDAGQDRAVVTLNDRAFTRRLGYQGAFAYYAAGEQLDAHRARQLGLVQDRKSTRLNSSH